MTQEQYTTKEKKFQYLTLEKRAQIEILLRQGYPKAQIAKIIGITVTFGPTNCFIALML